MQDTGVDAEILRFAHLRYTGTGHMMILDFSFPVLPFTSTSSGLRVVHPLCSTNWMGPGFLLVRYSSTLLLFFSFYLFILLALRMD